MKSNIIAPISMGRNTQYECNFHDEDGDKCLAESVSCGYCEDHQPSRMIENMGRRSIPASGRPKKFVPMPIMGASVKRPKHDRYSTRPTSKTVSIDDVIAEMERKHGTTRFDDDGFPQSDAEWRDFERQYGAELETYDARTGTWYKDRKKDFGFSVPPKPPVTLPAGKYKIIFTVDPIDKPGKFHIPHMQYIVLRTSKGYRAVWLSHNGVGFKGLPLGKDDKLFNFHWSKPFETFTRAEDQFYRGGESKFRTNERITNAKDPKWLPPNARKLATQGAWETLALTGAPEALIERLKAWKAAGCPGWRTWDGGNASNPVGSYDTSSSVGTEHMHNWMKKYGWKK